MKKVCDFQIFYDNDIPIGRKVKAAGFITMIGPENLIAITSDYCSKTNPSITVWFWKEEKAQEPS